MLLEIHYAHENEKKKKKETHVLSISDKFLYVSVTIVIFSHLLSCIISYVLNVPMYEIEYESFWQFSILKKEYKKALCTNSTFK